MVVPVFLGMQDSTDHVHSMPKTAGTAILATAVHATAYLLVAGPIAFLVFEKVGVGLLRKAWINLDLIWACALVVRGVANLLI